MAGIDEIHLDGWASFERNRVADCMTVGASGYKYMMNRCRRSALGKWNRMEK